VGKLESNLRAELRCASDRDGCGVASSLSPDMARGGIQRRTHAAIGLTCFRLYRPFQTLKTLVMYEEMIVTGAWWDFVDSIASKQLGGLLRSYPGRMRKTMLKWSRCADMWKRRSAIICQLGFKGETDLELLYGCIEPSLSSKEFFLQKAIGWALRQYAWNDPREVARHVREHEEELSPLSRREALKNIG
jgi:3-methyladenine DNA glycosylase AlkD